MTLSSSDAVSKHMKSIRVSILAILVYGLAVFASNGYGEELTHEAVYGASKAWHIQDFFAEYRDSKEVYLRIIDQGQVFLWDASRLVYTPWSNAFLNRLTRVDSMLDINQPLLLDKHLTLKIDGDFSRFSTSFSKYMSIYRDHSIVGQLYIVGPGGTYDLQQRFCCDSVDPMQTLKVDYDTITFLNAVKLGSEDLLFLFVDKLHSMYVLRFHTFPDYDLSLNNSIFIFPRKTLVEELNHAGPDLRARYQVIQHAMSHAHAVPILSLGKLVNQERFFFR